MSTSLFSTTLSIAAMALGFIGLLALLAFGFWASHRADLRSLPWLGIYLLLNSPLLIWLNAFLISRLTGSRLNLFGGAGGSSIVLLFGVQQMLATITGFLLAVLVMTDIAHLMERAGVVLDSAGVRALMIARSGAFGIGIVTTILALLSHLLALSYRL